MITQVLYVPKNFTKVLITVVCSVLVNSLCTSIACTLKIVSIPGFGYLKNKLSLNFIQILFLMFLCIHISTPSNAKNFKIYTEEFPPYNYSNDGKISGISTEIVREILRRLNHPDSIEIAPWSQAYRRTLESDYTILYSTTRTPLREGLFKWVGPLVPNNTAFFARTVSGVSINTLDEARKVGRIGVYLDDFGETLLKEKGFKNLRSVPDNMLNVADLVNGKIDLWIINELTGNYMAKEAKLADKIEKVFDVQNDFMFIAFSKNTPDSIIDLWQKTLDNIKDDGTYAQIFSTWMMFSFTEDLKPDNRIQLTQTEQQWIRKHQIIKIATDPDYPPFQFTDENKVSRGIANDYLDLMGGKLGINFKPVLTKSWSESQNQVKNRLADMLAVAAITDERKKYLLFSPPYAEFPDTLVVRNDNRNITSFDHLKDKKLASVSGFAVNDYLRENFPKIEIIEMPDTQSLLKSVSAGEVDAAILNLATTSYQIEKTQITNLSVSSKTDFSYKLTFASRSDWPMLNQLLTKALDSLTDEERNSINRKWIFLSQDLSNDSKAQLTSLTREEKKWLVNHPMISLGPDPSWAPIEYFDEKGKHTGMASDYILLLQTKLGITFKIERFKNRNRVIQALENHEIDVISERINASSSKEMLLTKPYLQLPSVIIVNDKTKGVLKMQALKGKIVSVVSGSPVYDYINTNYPDIIIDPVFNTVDGLRKVAFGKSYATITNVATSGHLMERDVIQNLRIAGESGFTSKLVLASRSDWPILNSILNKAIISITKNEHQIIFRKWIPIAEKPWIELKQFLIGLAIFLGALFVVGIVVWNRLLRQKVESRTEELIISEENFKNIYKTVMVGLFRSSIDGQEIYSANPAFLKLIGWENESKEYFFKKFIPVNYYAKLSQREELLKLLHKDGKVEEFEFIGIRRDGAFRSYIMNAFIYEKKGYFEGALRDITERKINDEIIQNLAMTDPLTGLANRNQFNSEFDTAINYSKNTDRIVVLILIDLDDFKPVNDNFGHPVGDKLLIHIAQKLRENFRDVDTIARLGGDEFAIVLNGVSSIEEAVRMADNLLKLIEEPIIIDQHSVKIGASMGICVCCSDDSNRADMLNNADKALYEAKAKGKNQIYLYQNIN